MKLIKKIYAAWIKFGNALMWVNSRILLTVLFFLLLTPLAYLRRWFGQPGLKLGFDAALTTYAEPVEPRSPDHFKYQF